MSPATGQEAGARRPSPCPAARACGARPAALPKAWAAAGAARQGGPLPPVPAVGPATYSGFCAARHGWPRPLTELRARSRRRSSPCWRALPLRLRPARRSAWPDGAGPRRSPRALPRPSLAARSCMSCCAPCCGAAAPARDARGDSQRSMCRARLAAPPRSSRGPAAPAPAARGTGFGFSACQPCHLAGPCHRRAARAMQGVVQARPQPPVRLAGRRAPTPLPAGIGHARASDAAAVFCIAVASRRFARRPRAAAQPPGRRPAFARRCCLFPVVRPVDGIEYLLGVLC